MAGKRALKVFLSYAHADRDAVKELYTRLKTDGVDAWLDREKLLPGQDWELEIRHAVSAADVVVVCLSCHFSEKGFRQREVRIALEEADSQPEGTIFIIPARLEKCESLENLEKWHRVDLFEEDGYEKLMCALQMRADNIGAKVQAGKSNSSADSKKSIGKDQTGSKRTSFSRQNKNNDVTLKDEPVKQGAGQYTPPPESSAAPKTKEDKSKNIEYFAAIATLVGAIATIFAAILGFPSVETWLAGDSTSTVTVTYTAPATFTPVVLPSDTLTPTATQMETATPTIEPTFTQTITSTATLPPRPADTVAPSSTATPRPAYSCIVINEKPAQNSKINRGNNFKIEFRLVNTGTAAWSEDLALVIVSNPSEIIDPDPSPIRFPRMQPGASHRFSFDATAPYKDGRYVITFKLGDGICWPYVAFNVVK